MTDEAAMPPPPAYPTFEEVEHSVYGFECDQWEEIPYPDGPDWFTDSERNRRNENANRYQKYGGTPTGWARYLELGFFGYEDCNEFEELWSNFDNNPLAVHKAIWYQFMYHLDREFEISEKLQEWTTNYSHIYVAYHEPESLQVDTLATLKEWKILKDADTSMEDVSTGNKDSDGWIDVPERGRRRGKSPPKETEIATPTQTTELQINGTKAQRHISDMEKHSNIPARQAIKELHNQLKQSKRYQKHMKPASKLPQVSTVQEEDEDAVLMEEDHSKGTTTATWSDALPKLQAFHNVPVNDGTHRLTVKWKPVGGIQQYEQDKEKLNTTIQTLLSSVLDDKEGMLYRWESKDLKASAVVSNLTGAELRDYVSPHISFIKMTSQIVFGVRVGFNDNPIKWQTTPGKKQTLKDNNVEIKISNSSSTGGKSVVAGYILLKAPNTTSTHRYTQYLRSEMPDVTPYFDIERHKKTPMDQVIPHLAIHCGERHVTPVCQALLKVLNGNGTATFLPRYIFSAMTEDQINNQFKFHEKWLHSVKALQLSPSIFHLDQQRIEYCNDGSIQKRSTREWATTLKLSDGSSALCDVVNGTKERKAYFLAPVHYHEQATEELRQYRMRLSPPSHREARFRDSVPDLPDEIHIKTAADSNVLLIGNLSTAAVWQKLPSYEIKHNPSKSADGKQNRKKMSSTSQPSKNAWKKPPEARAAQQQQVNEEDSSSTEGRTSVGTDELSTASTQSLTLASESKYQAKLRELEHATKKKLETLQLAGRAASRQLESLEEKFHTFATDTSQKIDAVQTELKHVVKKLEDSVNTQGKISGCLSEIQDNTAMQFEQIGEHLLTSGENVSILTNSMTDIRAELARMFGLMAQDIAARNESQQAASQFMPTPVPGRIGMINRDHMLSSSSQRSGSTSVPEHFGEIDATIVRSPPPKRTRKGITLSQRDYRGEQEHGMLLDLTDESIEVNDTTFEDVEDNIQDTTEEEFEHDLSTQQSDEVSRNLTARFDDVDKDELSVTGTPLSDELTSPSGEDPLRLTNEHANQTREQHRTSHSSKPAPLDPQYTSETGPVGAKTP